VPQCAASFDVELGWVYVLPEHRGKHYSEVLSAAANSQSDGAPVFATTRSDNIAMQKALERLQFRRVGDPYWSADNKRTLMLYAAACPHQVLARGKKAC
jgi:RimJ/RimL family protein N-acetyltransferase